MVDFSQLTAPASGIHSSVFQGLAGWRLATVGPLSPTAEHHSSLRLCCRRSWSA